MALAWLLNLDFAGSESTFVPPEPVKGGIPPKRKTRRRRRYILPDGRVFTDPDRVLFELQRLLTEAQASADPVEAAGGPDADKPAKVRSKRSEPSAPAVPSEPGLMSEVVAELPQLLKRVQPEVKIDPAIIELIEERQAEEEAILLAIFAAS